MGIDSVASHYKGDAGVKYSTGREQNVLNHLGYELQKTFFIPYLKIKMHVLDFGCGNGSLAKALEPYVASIEGVEINKYPRKLAINENHIKVYGSLDLLLKSKKYDAIISNHVLEHIPNVIDTLKIIYTHISPGGIFITMLPIDDFRSKVNRGWRADDENHHLHTWTPLLFGNTLSEAGFIPKELKIVTHAWTPKLFFLGDTWIQSAACRFLSVYLKRRQLLAVAVKSE